MRYITLNDVYTKGATKIWYAKRFSTLPDTNNIQNTHVLVGEVKADDPEKIFDMMQGERWSPRGEARELIQTIGTDHTSMSVGDAVEMNGKLFVCRSFGFEEVDYKK